MDGKNANPGNNHENDQGGGKPYQTVFYKMLLRLVLRAS
jgi:hypothetical protein